jgi:hypothetical protein
MKVTLSIIKHMIQTGAAIDVTNDETITRRPFNSTIIFHSFGASGLNGLVLRDDVTGKLYAVAGRVSNLFILAR